MSKALDRLEQRILVFSVFFLSLCGIIYELVLGSLATYLLGNPVQQYSITIGFFLSSMGLGSYLSRYLNDNILRNFITIEAILGFIGGVSVLVLSWLFTFSESFYFLHIFFLIVIGTLMGLEIPLITRILRRYGALKDILSNVLSLDYIGGLAGSLLFPLLLFPVLGRMLTCVIVGAVNVLVAVMIIVKIDYEGKRKTDILAPVLALAVLAALAFNSEALNAIIQKRLYSDDIVFSKRSKYQEIVLTRNASDFRLYIDGSLQFSSTDEYRYHEMLVFPAIAAHPGTSLDVAVLGGGDGLAVREVLKSERVRSVTLIELDPMMVSLARNNPSLARINGASLSRPGVRVITSDAFRYLRQNDISFDIIIADFPDPHDETVSKLYTSEFFRIVARRLRKNGLFVTQSTSPFFAPQAFWCINGTMKTVFNSVVPYHMYVPSFGDWGFNLAMVRGRVPEVDEARAPLSKCRYFTRGTFAHATHFAPDSVTHETAVNNFNRPVLYTYYLKGWKNYVEY